MSDDLAAILKRFADDYATDPMLAPSTFGVVAGGREWTVTASRGRVEVKEIAAESGWRFTFENADDLMGLDRGETHIGALMAKPSTGEHTPVDIEFLSGAPGASERAEAMRVAMHFWTRGRPEIVPFARLPMPTVHGVGGALLYAAPGMKALWFHIAKGQRANGRGEGVGPYAKLMVVVSGAGFCKIGEDVAPIKAGERVFVPPNVVNEFWNEEDAPLEGVLIIFGEGA